MLSKFMTSASSLWSKALCCALLDLQIGETTSALVALDRNAGFN
jgi:hypothetical protein